MWPNGIHNYFLVHCTCDMCIVTRLLRPARMEMQYAVDEAIISIAGVGRQLEGITIHTGPTLIQHAGGAVADRFVVATGDSGEAGRAGQD